MTSPALTATAAIVLAAGLGTRMKSALPKVMHKVAGRPLVNHVLVTLAGQDIAPVVVVIGPEMDQLAKAVAPHPTAIQHDRRGTAHAVQQAEGALKDFSGDIVVVYGDTPFIGGETIARMRAARAGGKKPAVVVLGFTPDDPGGYGRLVTSPDGLERIVEAKDATPAERAITLCNSGIMLVEAKALWQLLAQVTPNNAKNEFYLTDIVALARKAGMACAVVEGDEDELLGINSRVELAEAEAIYQRRRRKQAMENGATLTAPDTVYFSADTKVGKDVEIGPFTVFGPGVTVDDNAVIKGFCHIEGAHIAGGAIVGPYARLRPGADIGADAHVGNFVEVKNASLENGAKVNHLTYIGDARVGAKANIGAGTITANYDGFNKSRTDIGAGASIGSNSVLVAPVKIGDGAMTGAGAVVRKDVPADGLALNSSRQETREGFAAKYRQMKQDKKK
ncbi:MAG: bifunctional UDP-N-acetylglucosamine diphosphorylase/glucosamine-1-phosphate N-acetyltransferase GlmU [Proteobacteria bacterium]|nr:bifunctional UDP-N-acetylglucosamine diphosphorylase/glucosamine-1-phosphate N-acetyltransferase GlmU [Pseudomonadota bacterium]